MNAQELRLDYFTFYDVAHQRIEDVVRLQGQFDQEPERVRLLCLNLFANPASKNEERLYDKNAHLNFYTVYDPAPEPTRVVKYENQFGSGRLLTGRTYGLLAPTQKVERGSSFPERLDHYKFYQVLRGEPLGREVVLEDQFGRQKTEIFDPFFFAVPVQKWFEGETHRVHNEKTHLVIYRIYPKTVERTVKTRDQFGSKIQSTVRLVLLAAPTLKLHWEEQG